jgi:hypothetical protein
MNVIKHMEAAFLFSLSVAGVASVALDTIPSAQAKGTLPAVNVVAASAPAAAIPVVHVSAKRMTALEKQQSLAADANGSRL